MLNEIIKRLYAPTHEDDWILAETDRGFYELRMGGFAAIARFDRKNYEVIHEFPVSVRIEEAYTDEDSVYFHLNNGDYLLHHPGFNIDADGVLSAAFQIYSDAEIEADVGGPLHQDPDFRKLQIDRKGSSQ